MDFREFSGKTVEDAIIEAATTLGIASSELDIEVVNKGTSGFLGIGAKPAVIKAKAKKEVSDDIEDILGTVKKPNRNARKGGSGKSSAKKPQAKSQDDSQVVEEKKPQEKKEAPKPEKKETAPKAVSEEKTEDMPQIDDSIVEETRVYLEKLFSAMEMEADINITTDNKTRTFPGSASGMFRI